MLLTLSPGNTLIAQKNSHILERTLKPESTQRHLTILQHQVEQMLRRLYGRKSEMIAPSQLMFDDIILVSPAQNAKQTPPAAEIQIETEVR